MPLRQYVCFALFSRRTSAAEMSVLLGIEPDEVTVRAGRFAGPPATPVSHAWKIVCREPDLCVDEQIARVLDRLRPHTDRIAELAGRLAAEDEQHSGAVLEVVRYFNDTEEQQPPQSGAPDGRNLFGWALDRDMLDFLTATGAALDVDEYDMTPEPAE